jgi:hypothetical protein
VTRKRGPALRTRRWSKALKSTRRRARGNTCAPRPAGRCGELGVPGDSRATSHPRRPPRRSFGSVMAFDGSRREASSVELHPEGTAVRPRPPGARRNPSPTHSVVALARERWRGAERARWKDRRATAAAMRTRLPARMKPSKGLRCEEPGRAVIPKGERTALPPAATAPAVVAWRSSNAANPRFGTGMQQARIPRSGANRRGGAKPRGRNAIGAGCSGPKAMPARAAPGVDSTDAYGGGAIVDNPKRGSPAATSGGMDRKASGKAAPKVTRESRPRPWFWTDPRRWFLEGPGAAARAVSRRRPRRAAVNASDQQHLRGASPTVCPPTSGRAQQSAGPSPQGGSQERDWRFRFAGALVVIPWRGRRSVPGSNVGARLHP